MIIGREDGRKEGLMSEVQVGLDSEMDGDRSQQLGVWPFGPGGEKDTNPNPARSPE